MAEYLEHEKVLDDRNIITVQTKEYGSIEVIPVDTITDIELADVQPVIHAKWEICSDGYYPYCSNCKTEPDNGIMSNFCPMCGARMDGD